MEDAQLTNFCANQRTFRQRDLCMQYKVALIAVLVPELLGEI